MTDGPQYPQYPAYPGDEPPDPGPVQPTTSPSVPYPPAPYPPAQYPPTQYPPPQPAPGFAPPAPYASWWSRVGAALLDSVLSGVVLYLAFEIWNRVFRLGRRGQSIGKQALGIRVAAISHGGPIGAGTAFGRWIIQVVANAALGCLALVDVLWPLWDDKKQALHDKVVSSVVVRAR